MNTQEEIRENLDLILKYGDLHDVISLKEGVSLRKKPFLKFNILLLSRILYGGVLIWEKIKQHFAPIEKVKKAQDTIRKALGINLDIITFKDIIVNPHVLKLSKKLSLLYIENEIDVDIYIKNLQKIADFMALYNIEKIYLRTSDITDYFSLIDLSNFKDTSLKIVLGGYLEEYLDQDLLDLNLNNLNKLINKLKKANFNKESIINFGNNISDLVIQKAIIDFKNDNNLEKLRIIVKKRLEILLNSSNSFKDKIYGKVSKYIDLYPEYLKVITKNEEDIIIDQKVITLYEYLEVSNYEMLVNKKGNNEDKNLYLIAAFYLYLYQNKKVSSSPKSSLSFYDNIYKSYLLKKNKKIKEVKGIYSKSYKLKKNIAKYMLPFFFSYLIMIFIFFCAVSAFYVEHYVPGNVYSSILENIIDTIILPYKRSLELELELLKDPICKIGDASASFLDLISNHTGDAKDNEPEKTVCTIEPINDYNELPTYYATTYATEKVYNKGTIIYNSSNPNNITFENVTSLFEITQIINQDILKTLINNYKIDLTNTLYPLGDNYVLTKITIRDINSNKEFIIDYYRFNDIKNHLYPDEVDYLLTMESPEITYTYGLSENNINTFIDNVLARDNYYVNNNSSIRESIIKGLGLSSNASLEEILIAIKNKTYSKTPIKDANLSFTIKTLDENKYFETIASLDSLVCNLAASLAVESTNDLIYITGYLDNQDGNITNKEGHAWAINTKGDIIDVTPSVLASEEENIIESILIWGIENNIQIYIILTLIAIILNKLYGKKIIFNLKVLKVKNLLNNPDIYASFAKINEVLYGGINIPRKCSNSELISKITSDFQGFTKEDLKALKEKLKQEEKNNVLKQALKLVDEIPFIKDNSRVLRKK